MAWPENGTGATLAEPSIATYDGKPLPRLQHALVSRTAWAPHCGACRREIAVDGHQAGRERQLEAARRRWCRGTHWEHEQVHARERATLVRERMRALKLEDMRKQLDELKASAANRRKLADELEEQIKQIEACLLACLLDGWKTILA